MARRRTLNGRKAPKRGGPYQPAPVKGPSLVQKLFSLLCEQFSALSRPIKKNLAHLTYALLALSKGGRSGNGRLSVSAIARQMETECTPKSRLKRLYRFLHNWRFTPEVVVPCLVSCVLGARPDAWVPIILDQSDIAGIQTLMAGLLFEGRVLPVAFTCFDYPLTVAKSQNIIETNLLRLLASSFPLDKSRPVFIMDRNYGRLQLVQALTRANQMFIARAKKNSGVWINGQLKCLGRFKYRLGQPRRYTNVLYHGQGRHPVDLVIYRERGFKDVWYLLVPADSADVFSTDEVIWLYRRRMQIEQGFRDWKTHLGVRGLQLEVDPVPRLCRLLLAFALAYILVVVLGASELGSEARPIWEIPRRKPRHGTRRTLSALTIGSLVLGNEELRTAALAQLDRILTGLARSRGALAFLVRAPP